MFALLSYLATRPNPLSQADLATEVGLSRSSVAALLKKAIDRGYVAQGKTPTRVHTYALLFGSDEPVATPSAEPIPEPAPEPVQARPVSLRTQLRLKIMALIADETLLTKNGHKMSASQRTIYAIQWAWSWVFGPDVTLPDSTAVEMHRELKSAVRVGLWFLRNADRAFEGDEDPGGLLLGLLKQHLKRTGGLEPRKTPKGTRAPEIVPSGSSLSSW